MFGKKKTRQEDPSDAPFISDEAFAKLITHTTELETAEDAIVQSMTRLNAKRLNLMDLISANQKDLSETEIALRGYEEALRIIKGK